jgi:hypothetical protein
MYLVGFWALAKASSKLNFIKSPTSHTAWSKVAYLIFLSHA